MTEFIASLEEIAEPKTKLIGLVGGLLLLISVFLPWQSVSYMMVSISFSGLSLSGWVGAAGIISGLICILAVGLVRTNVTGILHISMGILALFVMLAVWFSQPDINIEGLPREAFPQGIPGEEWERMMNEFREALRRGITETVRFQVGFFLYILSSIAAIVGGLLEMREG